MNYAKNVANRAKKSIIDHIIYELGLICVANGTPSDEGTFSTDDDWDYNPLIQVRVDESYLDVYDDIFEQREVIGVYAHEDEKGGFVETKEGDEIDLKNLSVEELTIISTCLEECYKGFSN